MNVMNAFGERQHPEKFIPLCMNKILRGETLTIHAYPGAERAGSRWYIHARNIAAAVHFVLKKGTLGEKYNVQGEAEVDNLQIAKFVAKELGKELKYEMHDNPGSRPGHDLRYSLDGTKLRDMVSRNGLKRDATLLPNSLLSAPQIETEKEQTYRHV